LESLMVRFLDDKMIDLTVRFLDDLTGGADQVGIISVSVIGAIIYEGWRSWGAPGG